MITDLTISYVCNGIETTLTLVDDHYGNMPYNLGDMFAKVIHESNANPFIVIDEMKLHLDVGEIATQADDEE